MQQQKKTRKISNQILEMTFLSNHIGDYPGICQGKTRITGVNDGEEFELTDVSWCESVMVPRSQLEFVTNYLCTFT